MKITKITVALVVLALSSQSATAQSKRNKVEKEVAVSDGQAPEVGGDTEDQDVADGKKHKKNRAEKRRNRKEKNANWQNGRKRNQGVKNESPDEAHDHEGDHHGHDHDDADKPKKEKRQKQH